MIDYVATFVTFFAVIDPIGTVPVFIAVTAGMEQRDRAKAAMQAILVAAAVLVFFVTVGELILVAIGIPLPAFEIAGGIVLFLFALTMIFGDSKPDEELKMLAPKQNHAIFPLAVPSIASPGAMLAAVMQTENAVYSITDQMQVALVIFAVLLVALILMLGSNLISRIIGLAGASVVSRVMGLILSAVAVTSVLSGIDSYFGLGPAA
ncbi:MarC family transcriptional regulator [Halioglobus japonicus]|uniref:UPF0056 membrane protein n=1 Tax=Halioglobus japonicus TaxID=930805 RepID=A0AAP8MH24_9GAMM|nr:MarC family protein [Halioglobus japonicus]AQA19581.1 MarC family transcriptional regulator [Halioglobus japonicus]PLW87352.1 MarC family protein [Halioglobus japonicus]